MTDERLAEIEADAKDESTSHVRRAEMLELVAEVRRLRMLEHEVKADLRGPGSDLAIFDEAPLSLNEDVKQKLTEAGLDPHSLEEQMLETKKPAPKKKR